MHVIHLMKLLNVAVYSRAKYLTLTAASLEPGLHMMEEHLPGYSAAVVPPRIALTHHYRAYNCAHLTHCSPGHDSTVVNRRMWELTPAFANSYNKTRRELNKKCRG